MASYMTYGEMRDLLNAMPEASLRGAVEAIVNPAHAVEDRHGPNGQICVYVGGLVDFFESESWSGYEMLSIDPASGELATSTTVQSMSEDEARQLEQAATTRWEHRRMFMAFLDYLQTTDDKNLDWLATIRTDVIARADAEAQYIDASQDD